MGLAIYNGVHADLPLPLAFFKHLAGEPCTLNDLAELDHVPYMPSFVRFAKDPSQYSNLPSVCSPCSSLMETSKLYFVALLPRKAFSTMIPLTSLTWSRMAPTLQ